MITVMVAERKHFRVRQLSAGGDDCKGQAVSP